MEEARSKTQHVHFHETFCGVVERVGDRPYQKLAGRCSCAAPLHRLFGYFVHCFGCKGSEGVPVFWLQGSQQGATNKKYQTNNKGSIISRIVHTKFRSYCAKKRKRTGDDVIYLAYRKYRSCWVNKGMGGCLPKFSYPCPPCGVEP